MDEAHLLYQYRRKGELFLQTAGMTRFEYREQDSDPLMIKWQRLSVWLTDITLYPNSELEVEEFGITYERRIARSTSELMSNGDMVRAVQEAAFHNGWDYELRDTTLYLSPRGKLIEADHAQAAERLGVLDKFMNLYLRELFL